MLEFKPVTLSDKPWVDEIVMKENCPSADFNFGNMFIWDNEYHQQICRFGDRMITLLPYGELTAFAFPIGGGELRPAISAMREYAEANSLPFILLGITEKHREQLECEFPGKFAFTEDETWADYIYSAEKLATFSGRALHSKKNHCNHFEAEYSWDFVPLTRELIPGCIKMLEDWTADNAERLDESIHFENDAILRAFENYEALGLEGGVLRIEGKIVGFSLGEMCSRDTFNVHFEKADISINGAYTMVCRELTRMMMAKHGSLRYVNREDDMGLESLRKSKLSYKPEYLLKKYDGRWING